MTSTFLRSTRPAGPRPGPGSRHRRFTPDDFAQAARFFDQRPDLPPTPLVSLPTLARDLGLGAVLAKDETARFGLNAFKLLGARYAIECLIQDGALSPGATLVCASEGNHGRAVARTARHMGCAARVYLSASVAAARADAIAGEGAAVIRIDGTYDDAVRRAASDAAANGWTVVSDTSWPGYERIPWLIMLGYTRLMDEVARALPPGSRPDAVFVPGGVGGLLAAVATWSAWRWSPPPTIVAVEPSSAACLQASARAGRPTSVPGPFTTMMGGLRCGEVSPLAFELLAPLTDAYIGIDDEWAARAMRRHARPSGGDPAIIAGASGAAALGGLLAAHRDAAGRPLWDALGLGPESTVLLIVSEGMTDPPLWRQVVGR